ncbi:MAG TPA: acyl-CoA dehydrogenase family protein [Candidatus Dormibacteraeota bacterium]|nr:acyl-CoA dehydrogenase family protein [Candidatus Dormibacteraeota bacterium]
MSAATVVGDRAGEILRAVRDLAPSIAARASEIEAGRSLPVDLFEELKAIGLFRMLVPRSHGGDQVGLLASMEILETLAAADGSTGWTTMIGVESPQILSLLPRETYDAIYADGPDVTVGGSFAPAGQAWVEDGGYRVSGRWPFASGCERWDWLFANCTIVENGQPRLEASGEAATRAVLLPRQEVRIEDTWKVLGLRGTGSHHIVIEDLFVPEERTFDIFDGRPCVAGVARYPILDFCFHITSVAVGIAQAALDEVVRAARSRQRTSMRSTLARVPLVQYRLGRAETSLRAARAYLRAEAARVTAATERDDFDLIAEVARVYANDAWVAQLCAQVVDTCYTVNGSASISDGSTLQRCLRDIHTITQHSSLNESAITRAGAALLGEEIDRWF